jgi:hypothetical protein
MGLRGNLAFDPMSGGSAIILQGVAAANAPVRMCRWEIGMQWVDGDDPSP